MQWGLFSLQIPAGLFCGGTRVCFFSACARAGFFSLLFSVICFLGRERHLFFRGVVSLPPQAPPSLPALGVRRGVLHAAEFLCRSLQGASAVARACVFFACARAGFFSLLFSVICFWGGRDTSSSEALFLSLPNPLPLFQHWGFAAAFCMRLSFFADPCGERLRWHARVFFSTCARAGFFSLLFSVICFWGGRDTSSSEALFLSLPNPLPLFQHWGLAAAFCMRLSFFAVHCRERLRWHAHGVLLAGLRGVFIACACAAFFFGILCNLFWGKRRVACRSLGIVLKLPAWNRCFTALRQDGMYGICRLLNFILPFKK